MTRAITECYQYIHLPALPQEINQIIRELENCEGSLRHWLSLYGIRFLNKKGDNSVIAEPGFSKGDVFAHLHLI